MVTNRCPAAAETFPYQNCRNVTKVQRIFQAAYPKWHDGDALACRIGDTITVMNTREDEDVTESYAVPWTTGWLTKLTGKIGPQAYLLGKLEDQGRRLWLQANTEYLDRDTVLTVACTRKPDYQIEPSSAAKEIRWDEAAKTLNLRLSHQSGAVEIRVK